MEPVLKLLKAFSATLGCRIRVVEPTYSDAHRAQQNYIYERSTHSFRKPIFIRKKTTFKLLSIMLKSTFLKYSENKIKSSTFNFSDCCIKHGIEKYIF